jgi:predicted DNA-binding protein YlxM (UPF0122 family)
MEERNHELMKLQVVHESQRSLLNSVEKDAQAAKEAIGQDLHKCKELLRRYEETFRMSREDNLFVSIIDMFRNGKLSAGSVIDELVETKKQLTAELEELHESYEGDLPCVPPMSSMPCG